MLNSKRYTYRQEIARLRRQNRALRERVDALQHGVEALPSRGVPVAVDPPEQDAVRRAITERETRLRALEMETIWKPE